MTRSVERSTAGRAAAAVAVAMLANGCAIPSHPVLTEEVRTSTSTIKAEPLETKVSAPTRTLAEVEQDPPRPREKLVLPPERVQLEIAELRKSVLENNLGLKVELSRAPITQAQLEQDAARFDPVAFTNPSLRKQDPSGVPARTGTTVTTGSGDVGVRVPLRTGGTAQISLSATAVSPRVPAADDQFDTALGFSISQPLLRGAGLGTNVASIKISELRHFQQQAGSKVAIIGILASAESAYWQHYAAERTLEVRYQQYQRALEQQRQAKRLRESGVVPEIEVIRAKAGVARRLESIIVAENQRRATERDLKRLMNRPDLGLETPTPIVTLTEPRPLFLQVDSKTLADEAVEGRMELLNFELQLAIDALSMDVAKNAALPQVNLNYSYAYIGTSKSLANSLETLFLRDFNDQTLSLNVEVPIGNRAAAAQRRRASLQRALTLASRDDRILTIRKEIFDSADSLTEAWQRILAARQETLFAGQAYEGEQKLFKSGVRTSTDVLQALDFLADAQVREIVALAGYEVAKVNLAIATGTLLGYGSVYIGPQLNGTEPLKEAPYGIEFRAAAPGAAASTPVSPSLLAEVKDIVERRRAEAGVTSDPESTMTASTLPARVPASENSPGAVMAGGADKGPIESDTVAGRRSSRYFEVAADSAPDPANGASAVNLADRDRGALGGAGETPLTETASGATRSARTLAAADPTMYTVQLLSARDEGAVRAFVSQGTGLPADEISYFAVTTDEGVIRYSVVYGLYDDVAKAKAALASLPAKLRRYGPWVRRVRGLQNILAAN